MLIKMSPCSARIGANVITLDEPRAKSLQQIMKFRYFKINSQDSNYANFKTCTMCVPVLFNDL